MTEATRGLNLLRFPSVETAAVEAAPGTSRPGDDPPALVAFLRGLEARLQSIQLASADELTFDLLPATERFIASARNLLDRILTRYDHGGDEGAEIAGIVFLSLNELRTRQGRLANNREREAFRAQITDCSSIVRHLKRTLTAVEEAVCRTEGMAPALSLEADLELALEVRGAYTKFRRDLEAVRQFCLLQDEDAGPALCGATTSLARLTGRKVFPRLRLEDRVHVHSFQERIAGWQSSAQPEPSEARRIWEDLYAFTHLLQAVNQRQELLEHDQTVLEEILAVAAMASSVEKAGGRIRELAARLAGRNDTLDALLNADAPVPELIASLDELRRRSIGQAQQDSAPEDLSVEEIQETEVVLSFFTAAR